MIKNVEELRPELHVVVFAEAVIFDKREIRIDAPRPAEIGLAQRICRYGKRSSRFESAGVEPMAQRLAAG